MSRPLSLFANLALAVATLVGLHFIDRKIGQPVVAKAGMVLVAGFVTFRIWQSRNRQLKDLRYQGALFFLLIALLIGFVASVFDLSTVIRKLLA
jgi:hypothetical protein